MDDKIVKAAIAGSPYRTPADPVTGGPLPDPLAAVLSYEGVLEVANRCDVDKSGVTVSMSKWARDAVGFGGHTQARVTRTLPIDFVKHVYEACAEERKYRVRVIVEPIDPRAETGETK